MRRALLAAAVVGALAASGAAAAAPPSALVRAFQHTRAATSMSLTLNEKVRLGAQTVTVRLRGVQQPRAKQGSFVFSTTPSQPGLGQASEIVHGSRVYVHFAALDTLHARNPAVKTWVAVDAASNLGVDPSGLAALGTKELQAMTGIRVVGHGTDHGVALTRYRGMIDLKRAAQLPQLQQLLAHLPSASALVLQGKELMEIAVGADGYVHRIRATLRVPMRSGGAVAVDLDTSFADFGRSVGAIVPPPASEVMTLDRFYQVLGLPSPGDTALLRKVALAPAQVGRGYALTQIPGGQLVQGERTLDYCGTNYPSESLRAARLQVAYTKAGASFKVSNEVVTYRPGGAAQALREVTRAAATCANGPVRNPPSGVTRLVRNTHRVTGRGLLPGAVAVVDVETGTVKGKRVTIRMTAVYQVRGNVLDAVYGTGPSTAAVQAATLRVAAQAAVNLRHDVQPGSAPTS